jgi:hypothetical protein
LSIQEVVVKNILMIYVTIDGKSFDTARDVAAPERHVLQKLFLLEPISPSLYEFKKKRREALSKGWNDSGSISESPALSLIIDDLEKRVSKRLGIKVD